MDPQQRLLLRIGYHALEHAGYTPNTTRSWNRDTFGTFVGVATNDYVHNLRQSIDVYYSTGLYLVFLRRTARSLAAIVFSVQELCNLS